MKIAIFCLLILTQLGFNQLAAQQKKTTKKTPVKSTSSAPAKATPKPAENTPKPAEKAKTSTTQESSNSSSKTNVSSPKKSASVIGKNGNCFRKGNKVADLTIGFSGWGIPIAVQGEHFFTDDISGGVILSYSRYSPGFAGDAAWNFIYGGPRANYHFNRLIPNFPDNLDLYGGLSLGYWHGWVSGVETFGYNYGGTMYFAVNAGGRYYFTDNLGAIVELGGGNVSAIRAGVSLKF